MWLPTVLLLVVGVARLARAGSFKAQTLLGSNTNTNKHISQNVYNTLDELARIVDIAYCVTLGGAGIQRPFRCFSRCDDFPSFELVTTWNTGPLLSDSSGYIALSHAPAAPRVLVVFRGTYSISNAIVDLSTIPQPYVPYPGDDEDIRDKCTNCTVHSGFYASWRLTRPTIKKLVTAALNQNPGYELVLVGHSLGGAVAALGSLEFNSMGYIPQVTTFGEPRVGNDAFVQYLDEAFHLNSSSSNTASEKRSSFRRVTHVGDPVPLLPLAEWGYQSHGGEIFINKTDLPVLTNDIYECTGDADENCTAGSSTLPTANEFPARHARLSYTLIDRIRRRWWDGDGGMLALPVPFRPWSVLFAHRDYFYRLGLCVPGGDPSDSRTCDSSTD